MLLVSSPTARAAISGGGGESWQLASGHYESSNHSLVIVQPRPSLTTANRFYKAYPGLEYNVRVAVQWGSYPYNFVLSSAPSGMTINASTGEITWSNPVTTGSPHTVTVDVYDQENRVTAASSVTWTITVTTSGFLFVDPVNGTSVGGGGTGTLANPYLGLDDIYLGDENDTTHSGKFIYFRTGEHTLDNMPVESVGVEYAIPWASGKPRVWLNYPGESPSINLNTADGDAQITMYNSTDTYIAGIEWDNNSNSRGKSLSLGDSGRSCIYKCTFKDRTSTFSDNNADIFYTGGTAQYNVVHNCTGSNGSAYFLLVYGAHNFVCSDNTVSGTTYTLPFSPKDGCSDLTFRKNKTTGVSSTAKGFFLQDFTSNGNMGPMEICYNFFDQDSTNGDPLFLLGFNFGDDYYVFRNTIIGQPTFSYLGDDNRYFYFTRNVIVNGLTGDKIDEQFTVDNSYLTVTEDLTVAPSDNAVDSAGLLQGSYRTTYLGTRGWEVA